MMDISALLAPLISQVTQQVFSAKPEGSAKALDGVAFDQVMIEELQAKLRSTAVHEWPAVREAIAASKEHQPYALSIEADGRLFVLGKDGSKYHVELDASSREVLMERYGKGPHPLEINLQSQYSTSANQRPLHLSQYFS